MKKEKIDEYTTRYTFNEKDFLITEEEKKQILENEKRMNKVEISINAFRRGLTALLS